MTVTKICMAGAMGRMGRRILDLATESDDFEVGGAFDRPEFAGQTIVAGANSDAPADVTISENAEQALPQSDVLIDFTFADVCLANVRAAIEASKPAVVGTTGLSDAQRAELDSHSQQVPIVFAPNMSVGVNLLFKLAGEVAEILGLDYNAEVVEIHHNLKKDSPSGTAVRLAERVAEGLGIDYPADAVFGREGMVGERPVREIGVHAIRGGDVAGEHTVSFIGNGERVELVHKAHNRDNFARGALRAAQFAVNAQPGLYDMQDVLGLD